MAKLVAKGIDDLINTLENMEENTIPAFKGAVFMGAGIVADEIKARLQANLDSPRSVSLKKGEYDRKTTSPTGDLMESFGVTPIARDENGNYNAKVGFHGYDSKGVPNQLKARAMESGTSVLRKRPFVRPALNKARKPAQAAMETVLRNGLENMKESKKG